MEQVLPLRSSRFSKVTLETSEHTNISYILWFTGRTTVNCPGSNFVKALKAFFDFSLSCSLHRSLSQSVTVYCIFLHWLCNLLWKRENTLTFRIQLKFSNSLLLSCIPCCHDPSMTVEQNIQLTELLGTRTSPSAVRHSYSTKLNYAWKPTFTAKLLCILVI